jgi:hypothetical protein
VTLLSEKPLKPNERFFIQNDHLYRTDCSPVLKGGTDVVVRKGIPRTHVDLPPLHSIEDTGIGVPNGKIQVLLATVYKPPG